MDVSSVKKIMAQDTVLYLPAKIAEGVLGILLLYAYTNHFFTPEIYSHITYGTALINMANLVFAGWITQSATRYVSQYQNSTEESDFFKTIFAVQAVIGLSVICTAFIISYTVRLTVPADIFRYYIFMFAGFSLSQFLLPLLAFMRRIKLNLILSVSSNLVKLVLTYLFIIILKNNEVSPTAALLSYGITDLSIAAIIIFRINVFIHLKAGKVKKEIFKILFSYSLPFLGVNITTALLNQSDRLIVQPLAGDTQFGIYSANYVIPSMVLLMISTGVMRGVYPILLKSYNRNEPEQAAELLSQAIRYYLLIALPAVTGLISLSGRVSGIFLGEQFYENGYVISVVAAGLLCSGLVEYSNKAWELSADTKPIFRNTAVSAGVNIVINIVFIPVYGYRTAAVSTLLSFFLYLCMSVAGSRKKIKWYVKWSSFLKIALACIAMFLFLHAMKQILPESLTSLALMVVSGAFVYLAVLLVSGELKEVTVMFRRK
ncbi:MAG: oligosaccharide flippase family protein [Clostridiaceae bacterium]|nr:oligosaccharide flippase family protein [Clostridiaceae bacterium]